MGKFQDQLIELGIRLGAVPGAKLSFEVPLATLSRQPTAAVPTVNGQWRAFVEDEDGIVAECSGTSGEDALTGLMDKVRAP